MAMTRKEFIGGLAGGTVLLVFAGCGGGGYDAGGSSMSGSGCTDTIAATQIANPGPVMNGHYAVVEIGERAAIRLDG